MRKGLLAGIAAFLLCASPCYSGAIQEYDLKAEKQILKTRHKDERDALKLKERYVKESTKNQELPKSERKRLKHQMQIEKRELGERHKDQLQELKDRERSLKEWQRQ